MGGGGVAWCRIHQNGEDSRYILIFYDDYKEQDSLTKKMS